MQGVSLGTQTGNAISQNGPFSPLEWATHQGHRRCAELLAHASSAPARADAKIRKEVEKCVNGMVDTIAREQRQHERELDREQNEVGEVLRRIIREIERGAREELRKHNDARRKQREEEQQVRVVEKCLDDVIKRIVKEDDAKKRGCCTKKRGDCARPNVGLSRSEQKKGARGMMWHCASRGSFVKWREKKSPLNVALHSASNG